MDEPEPEAHFFDTKSKEVDDMKAGTQEASTKSTVILKKDPIFHAGKNPFVPIKQEDENSGTLRFANEMIPATLNPHFKTEGKKPYKDVKNMVPVTDSGEKPMAEEVKPRVSSREKKPVQRYGQSQSKNIMKCATAGLLSMALFSSHSYEAFPKNSDYSSTQENQYYSDT